VFGFGGAAKNRPQDYIKSAAAAHRRLVRAGGVLCVVEEE